MFLIPIKHCCPFLNPLTPNRTNLYERLQCFEKSPAFTDLKMWPQLSLVMANWQFFKFLKLITLALVGLAIQPQNGQRDSFTHQLPCFYPNSFGILITIKSSLTSGFFEKYPSTHHSCFIMLAWGLLQWKMTRKTLINCQLIRFELVCLLFEQAMAKCWCHNENLSPWCYQAGNIFNWTSCTCMPSPNS